MRAVVSVGVGKNYPKGIERLRASMDLFSPDIEVRSWKGAYPGRSPTHEAVPYAFKIHALEETRNHGFTSLLWLDSSMWAIKPVEPIFDLIEREGAVVWHSGHSVAQWCHDRGLEQMGITRDEASQIHLVAGGAVGIDTKSYVGAELLRRWGDYARDGVSFPGPWRNGGGTCSPDIRCKGHRHDMPSLSVIARDLGLEPLPLGLWDYYRPDPKPETLILARGM